MELQNAIELRHSVRKFKEDDVCEQDLREIIRAAGMAPSGKNVQNWHFAAVKNPELRRELASAVKAKNEEIADRLESISPAKAKRLRGFYQGGTAFSFDAPVLLVIYSSPYETSCCEELAAIGGCEDLIHHLADLSNPGMQTLGAAMENLALKAVELGYGTCWLTSANYAHAEVEEILRKKGGIDKEGYFVAATMALGVPADTVQGPKKKSVDEIFTYIE